jgi:transcriptional regulator with XRE-family HTH domain
MPQLKKYAMRVTTGCGPLSHHANMVVDRPKWFLKEWRKHRGYSQERLAELVGTSKGYVSDFETGKRRYNQDILEQFALALNTTPADLLRRSPSDPETIETQGLKPEQVSLLHDMVAQMRRAG